MYWIEYYHSNNPLCGYNMTNGGDGASHPMALSNEDLIRVIDDLGNSELSIKEIGKKYNVSTRTISDINNGKSRIQKGMKYPIRENPFAPSKEGSEKRREPKKKRNPKERKSSKPSTPHSIKVLMCDLDGNIIQNFPSIRAAARFVGCHP